MKASIAEESKWYVHGDHCGMLTRRGAVHALVTSTGEVKLAPDDELRETLGLTKATEALRKLATPGSGETASVVLRREIGGVLRLSQRTMRRIIERGDGSSERLEAPEDFKEHDYMGSFTVGDELVIADRYHVAETRKPLTLAVPAEPGTWHVYIRHMPVAVDVALAMFAVHESHLAAATDDGEELGVFGVDSGSVLIVDSRARAQAEMFKSEREWTDGMIDGLGCLAQTAAGDAVFPARYFRKNGRAIVVRASLSKTEDSYFQMPAARPAPTKKYTASLVKRTAGAGEPRVFSIKETFEVGDLVTHPKFGSGVVSARLPDGKVTIDFPDGARTLIHGR
jgi:hypothetical protein